MSNQEQPTSDPMCVDCGGWDIEWMRQCQSTHGHDCWGWGPKHYECAVREVKALRAEVERLNRLLGRIVEGDGDSTLTIRAGTDAFAAAREYLSAHKPESADQVHVPVPEPEQPTDLWRCTVCGQVSTVGRCCGEETREPFRPLR